MRKVRVRARLDAAHQLEQQLVRDAHPAQTVAVGPRRPERPLGLAKELVAAQRQHWWRVGVEDEHVPCDLVRVSVRVRLGLGLGLGLA